MRNFWVKVLIFGTISWGVPVWAVEHPTIPETDRLALSLDELAEQQPSSTDAVIRNGKRTKTLAQPVPLEVVTRVSADVLHLDPAQLREVLLKNHEKLSVVVYAQLVGAKSGLPWRDVVKTLDGSDALKKTLEAGVSLKELYERMDHLYTELAFAALDAPLDLDSKNGKGPKTGQPQNP